jgi:hypothetical protein
VGQGLGVAKGKWLRSFWAGAHQPLLHDHAQGFGLLVAGHGFKDAVCLLLLLLLWLWWRRRWWLLLWLWLLLA